MGSGLVTYPDLLPRHVVEEDVASLFLFEADLYRFGEGDVFRKPHFELGVEPPIAIRSGRLLSVKESFCTRVLHLQFGGDKFLENVSRLGVEDPEERLVGKAWYLLPHAVDVVNGVAFR